MRWEAHGLSYGVPVQVAAAVQEGAVAVVNVLDDLAGAFPVVRVVRVTVSEQMRRERILSRGREGSDAALARLHRADPAPGFPVDLEIVNGRELADAGDELVRFVDGVLAGASRAAPRAAADDRAPRRRRSPVRPPRPRW
ncbi:hypothetical protein [Microbacterium sp. YJN-G]|uniref:hypothetical protein n=1 Tax=Microbacterium sp. YJN-G TaxID=2763257 RepID=UPI001877F98C|nr:hypothetical protein [Microbacterium sp. YJN-G]